jgi:hypothetical protein
MRRCNVDSVTASSSCYSIYKCGRGCGRQDRLKGGRIRQRSQGCQRRSGTAQDCCGSMAKAVTAEEKVGSVIR